jgi:hypothetical protein
LFIYLTPFKHPGKSKIFLGTRFIPLSFKGEGEEKKEGRQPLLDAPKSGRVKERRSLKYIIGSLRGTSSLFRKKSSPSP